MSIAAAGVVTKYRLDVLKKVQCAVFGAAYNPESLRTGAKYLRRRLRGPSMVNYYPKDVNFLISKYAKQYPELELTNFAEAERLRDVEMKKARGKGAPSKAKDPSQSRRTQRRK